MLLILNQSTLILRYTVCSGASIWTSVRTGISPDPFDGSRFGPKAGRGALIQISGDRATVMMSS